MNWERYDQEIPELKPFVREQYMEAMRYRWDDLHGDNEQEVPC